MLTGNVAAAQKMRGLGGVQSRRPDSEMGMPSSLLPQQEACSEGAFSNSITNLTEADHQQVSSLASSRTPGPDFKKDN